LTHIYSGPEGTLEWDAEMNLFRISRSGVVTLYFPENVPASAENMTNPIMLAMIEHKAANP